MALFRDTPTPHYRLPLFELFEDGTVFFAKEGDPVSGLLFSKLSAKEMSCLLRDYPVAWSTAESAASDCPPSRPADGGAAPAPMAKVTLYVDRADASKVESFRRGLRMDEVCISHTPYDCGQPGFAALKGDGLEELARFEHAGAQAWSPTTIDVVLSPIRAQDAGRTVAWPGDWPVPAPEPATLRGRESALRAKLPFAALAAVEAYDRQLGAPSADGPSAAVVWNGKPYEFYYAIAPPDER
jgi:hypothetical protein